MDELFRPTPAVYVRNPHALDVWMRWSGLAGMRRGRALQSNIEDLPGPQRHQGVRGGSTRRISSERFVRQRVETTVGTWSRPRGCAASARRAGARGRSDSPLRVELDALDVLPGVGAHARRRTRCPSMPGTCRRRRTRGPKSAIAGTQNTTGSSRPRRGEAFANPRPVVVAAERHARPAVVLCRPESGSARRRPADPARLTRARR